MKLLILGGSGFVGRAVADGALESGAEVTMFNRGTRAPRDGVTVVRGDRTAPGGLAALESGTWDVVVDTWSAAPSAVRDTAALLAGRVGRYVYISSRSVYTFPAPAGLTEDGPVIDASPDASGDVSYAEAKRGAELAVERHFGERSLHVRAGLVLGPYEDVGRLPWWLKRMERGGDVLAPGPYALPLQLIDVRDLAGWTLEAARRGLGGAYDVVCPSGHTTMGELLEACAEVTGGTARLRWADPDTVLGAGIEPWVELPVWLPPGETHDAMHASDVSKALGAGLRCRPAADTVAGTWAWLRSIGGVPPQRPDRPIHGLSPEKEKALLATL